MRTSSSLGLGFRSSSAVAEMSIPGVQNPHWTPPCSRKARWSGMQLVVEGKTLDRRDLASLGLEREVGAGVHGLAVEQHHAGPALRVVAALLGAGQPDLLANDVEEARAGLDLDRVRDAVDSECCGVFHGFLRRRRGAQGWQGWGQDSPLARATAASIARRVMTAAIARR